MKFRILTLALLNLLFVSPVIAQQQPDPQKMIITYRQLLSEANDRIASLSSQIQTLQKELETIKAEKNPNPQDPPK